MEFIEKYQALLGAALTILSIAVALFIWDRQTRQARRDASLTALMTIETNYRAASSQIVAAQADLSVDKPNAVGIYLATFHDYARIVRYICELNTEGLLPPVAQKYLLKEIVSEVTILRQLQADLRKSLSSRSPLTEAQKDALKSISKNERQLAEIERLCPDS